MPTNNLRIPHTTVPWGAVTRVYAEYNGATLYQVGDIVILDDKSIWMCTRPNYTGGATGGPNHGGGYYNDLFFNSARAWVYVGDTRLQYGGRMQRVTQVIPSGVDTKILLDTMSPPNGIFPDYPNNELSVMLGGWYELSADIHIETTGGLVAPVVGAAGTPVANKGSLQLIVYKRQDIAGDPWVQCLFEERPILTNSLHFRVSGPVYLPGGNPGGLPSGSDWRTTKLKLHAYHTNGGNVSISSVNPTGISLVHLGAY